MRYSELYFSPYKHISFRASKNFANQIVIEVPVKSFKNIKKYEGVGSVYRETKHFTGGFLIRNFVIFG